MSTNIDEVLANDTSYRVVGIDRGLVPLGELELRSWDFAAPTLVRTSDRTYRDRKLCPGVDEFRRKFFARYPVLAGVDLSGMLVAGGAVGQFVTDAGWTAGDVDLFLYGHGSTDASLARVHKFAADLEAAAHERGSAQIGAAVNRLVANMPPKASDVQRAEVSDLFRALSLGKVAPVAEPDGRTWSLPVDGTRPDSAWIKKLLGTSLRYRLPEVRVVRTSGSVTIEVDGTKLQIILRHYATASEVLHGFDLGSAAVGFDGSEVWLTGLGRFAYEAGYNIVDTSRRSRTYEARLRKYARRGFDLILPGLDVDALPRKGLKYGYPEVADLPFLPFAYKSVGGNRIVLKAFLGPAAPESDYDLSEELECGGFSIAYMNLFRLVNGRADFIYTAEGHGFGVVLDALTKPPHLSLRMLQRLYDQFRGSVWDGRRLNTRMLQRYVPVCDLGGLVAVLEAGPDRLEAELDRSFTAQREAAIAAWKENIEGADHSALPWVTENPGGQDRPLTGSLNPIVAEPADWYGEYFQSAAGPSSSE